MSLREQIDYLRFPIGPDCEVIIGFYGGPVTQEGIEMLQAVLDLSKDCYPKAEKPEALGVSDLSRSSTEANEGAVPSQGEGSITNERAN